jgi:hypothetical protein
MQGLLSKCLCKCCCCLAADFLRATRTMADNPQTKLIDKSIMKCIIFVAELKNCNDDEYLTMQRIMYDRN